MQNRVRRVREALGIGLRELAREVNVSAPLLSRAERGCGEFYPALRKRVAKALGVEEDLLFAGEATEQKAAVDIVTIESLRGLANRWREMATSHADRFGRPCCHLICADELEVALGDDVYDRRNH